MPPSGSKRSSRSENACESCRKQKIKCSGTHPCSNCHRRGRECHFEHITKRSGSYIRGLLSIIEDQKRELKALSNDDPSPTKEELGSPADESGSPDNDEGTTPIQELPPGPIFESRMRSILRDHADRQRPTGISPESVTYEEVQLPDRPVYEWRSANDLIAHQPPPKALTKAESSRLVDLFISQMGIDQHFVDPRAFYDAMILLYKDEQTRNAQMQSIWFIQYLLLMALGMLISSPSTEKGRAPGCSYFAEAMRRLPPTYQLGSHGIISVEILCLITLYLQWRDRKHEAYVHIGLAIRLAIALGCTLPLEEQEGLPSEICHRTRVWWTAYMLDRRLSAGLGFPTGADDRQLRAELPQPSAGFQPPLPLIINIQIAQVTGDIMTSFYGNSKIPQSQLYQRIQDTLQTLAEKGRSIPPGYVIDFSQSEPMVSRTSATLYLMLFQAIILCTRPFLLHRVKEKVEACKRNDANAPTASPLISRLCKACKEAATKSVKILTSLRKQEIITLFGYFDLDATFSTAIVLIMMGFIDTNDSQRPPDNLEQVVEVLQYLSAAGNTAAERRLNELKQFCRHVWSPSEMSDEWRWLGVESRSQSPGPSDPTQPVPPTATLLNPSEDSKAGLLPRAMEEEPSHNNFWPETWDNWDSMAFNHSPEDQMTVDTLNFNMDNSLQMDFTSEAANIYSSFNDPNLQLTGVNDADWTEIGKMFKNE